jgi:hypothetical protein
MGPAMVAGRAGGAGRGRSPPALPPSTSASAGGRRTAARVLSALREKGTLGGAGAYALFIFDPDRRPLLPAFRPPDGRTDGLHRSSAKKGPPPSGEPTWPPAGPLAPGSELRTYRAGIRTVHLRSWIRTVHPRPRIKTYLSCGAELLESRGRSSSQWWSHPGRIDPMIGGAGGIREMFCHSCDFQNVLSSSVLDGIAPRMSGCRSKGFQRGAIISFIR